MRPSRRGRAALLILAFAVLPSLRPVDVDAAVDPARLARMKSRQAEMMQQGMKRKFARRHKTLQERLRFGLSPTAALGAKLRMPAAETQPAPGAAAARALRASGAQAPSVSAAIAVNERMSSGDPVGTGQCEVSIAAHNGKVLAAWNDGTGFLTAGESSQGYAWSTDNGQTWTDAGIPPETNVTAWSSDPVVAVNEKTGVFYFCALADPSASTNAVGIVRADFGGVGGSFRWLGNPVIARLANNATEGLDKQWVAVDSSSSNVYISYSSFSPSSRIMFIRSTDAGLTWSAPTQLSNGGFNGYVQGSRVAVGPKPAIGTAPVYATWYTVGIDNTTGKDYLQMCKSTTGGTIWGGVVIADSIFANWGSGAPGFNRGMGFTFPSVAVDQSQPPSPTSGRVYLSWHESVNFYADNLGFTSTVIEINNNNDTPGTATPLTINQAVQGTIATGADFDYYAFAGNQGQTVIAYADTVTGALDASFRLFCSDGTTRLGYSVTGSGAGAQGLIVFTLPKTGTYYIRLASSDGSTTGGYKFKTGFYTPQPDDRARDMRDVFVRWSTDGVAWVGAPAATRVNQDPAWFDDWLPEIAVAPNRKPYVAWYDWEASPVAECGGRSNLFVARSEDAAATWTGGSPVTDVQSAWTNVASNIAPNQGDYIALFANATNLYAAWSDGRTGDPEAFMAAIDLAYTATAVALVSAHATSDRVELEWHAAGDVMATVYRRTVEGDWAALGATASDGSGRIAWVDHDVVPGTRYGYRLGVHEDGGETFTGETWVDVPLAGAVELAIAGLRPNPTNGPLRVAFTLPSAAPATLEVLDIGGRRVRTREVGGAPGAQVVDLGAGSRLNAGVYLVRLTQSGRSVTSRLVVVR